MIAASGSQAGPCCWGSVLTQVSSSQEFVGSLGTGSSPPSQGGAPCPLLSHSEVSKVPKCPWSVSAGAALSPWDQDNLVTTDGIKQVGAEEVGELIIMVLLVGLFALGFSKLYFF